MFKRIISYLSLFFTCLLFIPIETLTLNAEEQLEFELLKTVDEDLSEFDFDYERYFIDKSLCYRPIVIFFNELISLFFRNNVFGY